MTLFDINLICINRYVFSHFSSENLFRILKPVLLKQSEVAYRQDIFRNVLLTGTISFSSDKVPSTSVVTD